MGFFDFFKKKKTTTPIRQRYTKVKIYYKGDGINSRQYVNTRQNVTKEKLLSLNKKVQDYGYSHGWDNLQLDYREDHVIILGGGNVLQDNDINDGSNEYILSILSHSWYY